MADSDELKTPQEEADPEPGRPDPPTREQAERKAFWKKAVTVAAGVVLSVVTGWRIFRRGPRI